MLGGVGCARKTKNLEISKLNSGLETKKGKRKLEDAGHERGAEELAATEKGRKNGGLSKSLGAITPRVEGKRNSGKNF